MLWLISNWKVVAASGATAVLGWLLHTVDVDRIEAQQRLQIEEQVKVDTNSCNADKAITEGISHDYELEINNLSKQLGDLQRVRPNVCVTIASKPPAGRDAATSQPKPVGQDGGVNSDALYSLAAEGERYRLQLGACQKFITETWAEQAAKQQ